MNRYQIDEERELAAIDRRFSFVSIVGTVLATASIGFALIGVFIEAETCPWSELQQPWRWSDRSAGKACPGRAVATGLNHALHASCASHNPTAVIPASLTWIKVDPLSRPTGAVTWEAIAMRKAKQVGWPGFDVAQSHLQPLETFLDRISDVLGEEYDTVPVLERHASEPFARNTYDVEYVLRSSGDAVLSLSFIVTGENADLFLLQTRESSGDRSTNDAPGQTAQRVFHLNDMDHLKEAVQDKIVDHILS